MQSPEELPNDYLTQADLQAIFGFGRDKMKRFLSSGILPVVRINSDYYISRVQLEKWFQQNAGKKIVI